jgi:hypothetical protein
MANATPKQIDFLKSLLNDRALDFNPDTAIPDVLTKAVASYWIDLCLRLPYKCSKCGQPKNGRFCDSCKGVGTAGQDVEDGYYADGEEIAVVKMNRDGTRKYAMRFVEGSWAYEPGLISKVAKGWGRLTVEQAAEYGKLYGRCMICGRTLTDPESIERGIGPICAGKLA